MPATRTLDEINSVPAEDVTAECAELFGSKDLADALVARRPFVDSADIIAAMMEEYAALSDEQIMASVNAHPPIGAKPKAGSLSESEQRAALKKEQAGEDPALESIRALNEEHQDKFGYVFLIRAAGLTSEEILEHLDSRLGRTSEEEWETTKSQLKAINELRLEGYVN